MMEEEAVAMSRVVKDSLEGSMMVVEQVVQNTQNLWKWFRTSL